MMKAVSLLTLLVTCYLQAFAALASDSRFDDVNTAIRLRDHEAAVQLLLPMANGGDAEAQYRLAEQYRSGEGVISNLQLAERYYREAAEQGFAAAQYSYASLLARQHKQAEALLWLQRSAAQGHRLAIRKLAKVDATTDHSNLQKTPSDQVFDDVLHQRRASIESLIRAEYNFNIIDRHKRTPLMLALKVGDISVARMLLAVTSLLDQQDEQGLSALHFAVLAEDAALVNDLLDLGVAVNAKDHLGNTPLMLAVKRDQNLLVKGLLDSGADGYLENRKGQSPLQAARVRNNLKVLATFKNSGLSARPLAEKKNNQLKIWSEAAGNQGDLYPGWPLQNIAAHLGEDEILRQLLAEGVDVNQQDADGNTSLHRASAQGNLNSLISLINNGARIDSLNSKHETPLFMASRSGRVKAVEELLKRGADPQISADLDDTALLIAIRNRYQPVARRLSEVASQGGSSQQAIVESLEAGYEQVAMRLLNSQQNLALVDERGRTLLWYSIENNMEKVSLQLLSMTGLQLNQVDDQGYNPLQKAVIKGSLAVVRALLKLDVNLDVRTREGNSLLMLAVMSGSQELVNELLSRTRNLDEINNAGNTALMVAASAGELEIAKILIDEGADIHQRNHDDLNAFQVAERSGFPGIADLIDQNRGTILSIFK